MVNRNRGFPEDESAISAPLSDVLLFTTMCIVGHPVDVYVKDGSVFSGIFHTASIDKDYAIVLKGARMIKKGNRDANVANKGVIETLIVQSEDLVQVVSKGVSHSEDDFSGNVSRDDVGASSIVPGPECGEEAQTMNNGKRNVERKRHSKTRGSSRSGNSSVHGSTPKLASHIHNVLDTENGKSNNVDLSEKEEACNLASDARRVRDGGPQHNQVYREEHSEKKELNVLEVQSSSTRNNSCDNQIKVTGNIHKKISSKELPDSEHGQPAHPIVKLDGSEGTPCAEALSSGASAAVTPSVTVTLASYISSSSTLTEMVPPKRASSNRTTKVFKLNPGAKIFSPSFAHQRSATPPVVPTATYLPDNSSMISISTPQREVEISSLAPRSMPMKYIPYGSLVSGNGGSDVQYPQPIVGHLGSRTQPIRYGGQYHPVQPGTTYIHPPSQNVMVGRLGPVVYVHPLSHDVVQSAAAFSQVSTFPLVTPHQVHLPKHQGNGTTAQMLQLASTPPFVTAGQQPFTLPSQIPIPQPHFPVIRPMPVPGSNGFLGAKFS